MLFDVPERLLSPADGALPDAPGVEPEPASFAPVAFAVPELLTPTDSDQELERPAVTCATVATRGRPANAATVIPIQFFFLMPAGDWKTSAERDRSETSELIKRLYFDGYGAKRSITPSI